MTDQPELITDPAEAPPEWVAGPPPTEGSAGQPFWTRQCANCHVTNLVPETVTEFACWCCQRVTDVATGALQPRPEPDPDEEVNPR